MAVVSFAPVAIVYNRVNIRTLEREQKKTNFFNEPTCMEMLSTQG